MPRRMRYSVIVTFFGILSLLYATSVFVRDYEIVPRRSPHQEHDHHLDKEKSEPAPAPAPATQDRDLHPLPPECDYCGPTDTLCKQYGEHNLARSRAYEGTNARLKRVIAKARRGEPVIISVLGGSVTKGHGIHHVDHENWSNKFFLFWNRTFPHPDNVFINGAVPAVTSSYYMTCALEHIDANSDLILMEMSINDTTQPVFMEAFEWLVRRLLRLPNRPAIIDTQILALSFDQILMGGDVHMGITQYYDIPTVSLKNVIAGHIMRDAQLEHDFFENPQQGVDLRHMNVNGHRMLGELLVSYVRRQICDEARYKLLYDSMERSDSMARLLPSIDTVEELPKMRLYSKYHANKTAPDLNPTCMSMNSKKNPLKPVSTTGWVEWSWKDKPYLIAKNPGDKVTFEIRIDSLGSVTMSYLRSKTFGLGKLKCWLDNDVAKAKVLSGYWTYDKLNLVRDDYIVVGGSPGKHLLNCEILKETDDPKGGHEFRIVAITTT